MRGYFFCRYCGSFHFPDTKADDGVRIVGDDPMSCAVCDKPLSTAMLDETHSIKYCRNCRGLLIARKGFAGVVEKCCSWATDTPTPPVLLDHKELLTARCTVPRARRRWRRIRTSAGIRHRFLRGVRVVWLDFGELPADCRRTRQGPRHSRDAPSSDGGDGRQQHHGRARGWSRPRVSDARRSGFPCDALPLLLLRALMPTPIALVILVLSCLVRTEPPTQTQTCRDAQECRQRRARRGGARGLQRVSRPGVAGAASGSEKRSGADDDGGARRASAAGRTTRSSCCSGSPRWAS